jgi:CPA2 family monovalent cation:H+ antiporter-2
MPHDVSLIATIASAFGLAMVLGLGAARLKLPPLVGYLLAGVVVSPFTPGYVADVKLAAQLAEIGVMLLMFGVGLHFSVKDLLAVRHIAVPGAFLQMLVATALGAAAALLWGWPWAEALMLGLCLSVASTVVLLKALEARGMLQSASGQIAVGWLVVEDMVMVLALVLVPVLAGSVLPSTPTGAAATASGGAQGLIWTVGATLLKVAGFVALMWVVGRRVLPRLLWWVAGTGSQELFRLAVVAIAIGVAFGAAQLFSVSFALGAFFAGMMMRESEFAHRAADESLPLRDAFAVLFFVSVGMLFDPAVLWTEPVKLLTVVTIVMLGKTLAAVALVLLFRYPLNSALTVGVSLAQVGEFSFILAGLGVSLGLMSPLAQSLVLASALISIALNPALFSLAESARVWLLGHARWARALDARHHPLEALPDEVQIQAAARAVVVVGAGSVGQPLLQGLGQAGKMTVAVDLSRERVEALRSQGILAVCGDAADPSVLVQAHIVQAGLLILTVGDAVAVRQMLETARTLNPQIRVLVCAASAEEAQLLEKEAAGQVLWAQRELALGLEQRALKLLQTE